MKLDWSLNKKKYLRSRRIECSPALSLDLRELPSQLLDLPMMSLVDQEMSL